ncbi:MAG: pitrilysin family protein [bacterium]|nr:pitrilysin family protein [bacterium]
MNSNLFTRTALTLLSIALVLPGIATAQTSKTKKPATTTKSAATKKATTTRKKASGNASMPDAAIDIYQIDPPDLKTMPKPLQATAFAFPTYQEFTLSNGLHVFVVENHEQPTLTFSLINRSGDVSDPANKEGTAAMMGDMLSKGTKEHTAKQIAESLDGVGASIGVNVAGEALTISGSSLKKHAKLLFGLLGEMVRTPTFPEDEMAKIQKQFVANVAYERSRPVEMAQALSRKVVYGMESPLARRRTEQSVQAVKRDDIANFHTSFLRPNRSSIAIVGDVNAAEVKQWLNTHLGSWTKGDAPEVVVADIKTEPAGVYFIPRKGAVQSAVIVGAAAPALRASDYDAVSLTTDYMGSGFGSVLFNTLRETYSYTYSPFGFTTSGRRYNRIALGAEVRSSVTDSAIHVILRELRKLGSEGPDEDQLLRRKAFEVGQYRLAFERPTNVAAILQSSWLNDVPIDDVINYTDRIERLTSADVQGAATQYLGMFDLRIIVVGSPDVKEKLEQFGPVKEFTMDLAPATAEALTPVSSSAEEIVDAYVGAMGGRASLDKIQTLTYDAQAEFVFQGQAMKGTYSRKLKVPNKEVNSIDLPMLKQQQWVDGSSAWVAMSGGPASQASGEEIPQFLLDARLFPLVMWKADKYMLTVKGKQNGMVVVDAVSPLKRNERYYFDDQNKLLVMSEQEEPSPQGPITTVTRFEDYVLLDGIMLPKTIKRTNALYSMTTKGSYTLNTPLADDVFVPVSKQ